MDASIPVPGNQAIVADKKEASRKIFAAFLMDFIDNNKATLKKYAALTMGFIAILLWVTLFTTGLNIPSNYYRAAVSYNYADWEDWMMMIFSFTLTNVILLAFLSGFLGGICSKVIVTEGFTKTTEQLKKDNADYVLFENPAISAFRGVFIFIALLTFQYISSFSDLGSIGKSNEPVSQEKDFKGTYYSMLDSVSDSATKQKIKSVWQHEEEKFKKEDNDTIASNIRLLQDSLETFKNDKRKTLWKEEIMRLRGKIQIPVLSEIPGLSASGYFRFAIIVSMLAFICGYDPKRFTAFLKVIPALSKTEEDKDKKKEEKK